MNNAEPNNSVGSVQDLRTRGRWFDPRLDDSPCDRIHCSLTAVHCFDNSYVGKEPAELVKRTPEKHGWVHWTPRYNCNTFENEGKQTYNQSTEMNNEV